MKTWIVILDYDKDIMLSILSAYPEIDEDFLFCGCFYAEAGEEYYSFTYESLEINIEPAYFREIKTPPFDYHEKVKCISPGFEIEGVIYKILWNFEYQEFRFYLITEHGKILSYYTENDLVS